MWLQIGTIMGKMSGNHHQPPSDEQMHEEIKHAGDIAKDPASFSIVAWLVMMVLSTWGAIVRVIREKAMKEKNIWQILVMFLAEMSVSGFVGTITYSLCIYYSLSFAYTGALTAISGYMGGRTLAILELVYKAWRDEK
jgi:hypothetical protein